jgi:hypothetical protein
MSRSTPIRQLYCSRCKAKHFLAALCGEPKHFNVIVRGRTSSGAADCRCNTCGHTWISNSARGRRLASKLWTPAEQRVANNLVSEAAQPPSL